MAENYKFESVSSRSLIGLYESVQEKINEGWEPIDDIVQTRQWNPHPHCEGWDNYYVRVVRKRDAN